MATIEVNRHKINFDEQNYLNLKSLLPKLQRQFPMEEFNIESLKINGQSIDINSEHPSLIRPIENADHIEIQFEKYQHNIQSLISELSQLTDKIIQKIDTSTDLYKNDEDTIAELHLAQIVDAVDVFIKSICQLLRDNIDLSDLDESLPIKELQIHLLSILKAINSAHQKSDLIMLTDLLEYELKDNLTQWKILIIPTLKSQIR